MTFLQYSVLTPFGVGGLQAKVDALSPKTRAGMGLGGGEDEGMSMVRDPHNMETVCLESPRFLVQCAA